MRGVTALGACQNDHPRTYPESDGNAVGSTCPAESSGSSAVVVIELDRNRGLRPRRRM